MSLSPEKKQRGGARPGAGRKPGKSLTALDLAKLIKSPITTEKLLEARLHRFSLSKAQYEAMLTQQRGRCALCEEPLSTGWVIDHCHLSMKVRGLLHQKCNLLLGIVNEDPRRLEQAIAYLKKHNRYLS